MQLATKILIVSVILFLGTIIILFLSFHKIMEFGVRDQISLRKRNAIRSLYLKIPFPLIYNFYFFNVTNPDEVTEGGKPILREVGPYAYDEWVSKVDVVDNNSEDTLAYNPVSISYPNPEKNGPGLSHDDYVTVLHPVIVGAVTMAAETSPALLPILAKAIKSIFRDPKTMYITDKVKNILFDGMTINCTVSDFAGKAVCSQLKTQVPGVVEVEKNIFKFSLLGARNGTLGKRITVKRGIKKSQDLGTVVEYDGLKELNMYENKSCNKFHGTDGWIFPPGLKEEDGLWIFAGDLCRSVQAKFVRHSPEKGIPTDYYEGDMGDQEHDPSEKCFCPTPKTCLKKGLYSLTKCLGVPIIASLPHFLKCDESVFDGVEGMHPDITKHNLEVYFSREIAAPTRAYKRIQFNFLIKPIPKISVMSNVPEVLHPLLWLEEGVVIEGPFLKSMQAVFFMKKLNSVGRWFLLLLSIGGFGVSGYLYYQNRRKGTITPIHMIKKMMGNNDEVKEFKSELSSAVSRISEKTEYDNSAFINEDDNQKKMKF